MSYNRQTAKEVALDGLKREFPGWTNEMVMKQTSFVSLVKDIVEGVYEGERRDLTFLKSHLSSLVRHTAHSCVSDEHCCALHAAHKAAAEEVEKEIQKLIDEIGKGEP